MSLFNDREKAFETKFAHDSEMQFRAEARRNKLVGLWAAALLGKTGAEAEDYAREVIASDFEEAGVEDVVRKLSADLGERASVEAIRAKLAEMLPEAKAQLLGEI